MSRSARRWSPSCGRSRPWRNLGDADPARAAGSSSSSTVQPGRGRAVPARGRARLAVRATCAANSDAQPSTRDELVDALWPRGAGAIATALSPLALEAAAGRSARRQRRASVWRFPTTPGSTSRRRARALHRAESGRRAGRLSRAPGAPDASRSTSRRAGSCRARTRPGSTSQRRRLEEILRPLAGARRRRPASRIGGGELDTAERAARQLIELRAVPRERASAADGDARRPAATRAEALLVVRRAATAPA